MRTPKHTIFPCLNHSSDGLGPSEYFPVTKTHDLSMSYQVHYVYKEKSKNRRAPPEKENPSPAETGASIR